MRACFPISTFYFSFFIFQTSFFSSSANNEDKPIGFVDVGGSPDTTVVRLCPGGIKNKKKNEEERSRHSDSALIT